MTGPKKSGSKRPAPHGGVWVLALAIPFAVWSMLASLAMAAGIGPLADFTPALILGLAFLTRDWAGVATRWFAVAAALAGVMALQWIPWYAWMFTQRWPGTDVLNILAEVYAAELLLLVVLTTVTSVLSIRGIKRQPAAPTIPVLVDVPSIES